MDESRAYSRFDKIDRAVLAGNNPIFEDVGAIITQHFGGRPFFFEVGAKAIHRCGIRGGLGFLLPFGEARDHIDSIRVIAESVPDHYLVEFGKNTEGNLGPQMELIRSFSGVRGADIRALYDKETGPNEEIPNEQ